MSVRRNRDRFSPTNTITHTRAEVYFYLLTLLDRCSKTTQLHPQNSNGRMSNTSLNIHDKVFFFFLLNFVKPNSSGERQEN